MKDEEKNSESKEIVVIPEKIISKPVSPPVGSEIVDQIHDIMDRIKDPSSPLNQDDHAKLTALSDPELRKNLLGQLFFIDKISKSTEYQEILHKAVKRINDLMPDMGWYQTLRIINSLKALSESESTSILTYLNPPVPRGGVQVTVDSSRKELHLHQTEKPPDEITKQFANIPPERLEKVLRLVHALAEKSKGSNDEQPTGPGPEPKPESNQGDLFGDKPSSGSSSGPNQ